MSLPPAVSSVIELFQGPLANVRFADVDATGLASLAGEVEAAAAEVEAHEMALVELKQSLAQRQEALLALAQQALAYARVYAENNDEQLLDAIGAIALPRATTPRTVKPRKASKAAPRDAAAAEQAAGSSVALAAEASANEAVANVEALVNGEALADGEPHDGEDAPVQSAEAVSDETPARTGRKGRPRAAHAAAG
jgi:hypothetical protein